MCNGQISTLQNSMDVQGSLSKLDRGELDQDRHYWELRQAHLHEQLLQLYEESLGRLVPPSTYLLDALQPVVAFSCLTPQCFRCSYQCHEEL